ncbi:unnamed protein product, partial [Durusdinium trenchii]
KVNSFIANMRADLHATYDKYFQHFDDAETVASDNPDPASLCRKYLLYVNQHTQKYRKELQAVSRKLIFALHEKEGPVEYELQWLCKLVAAYQFHRVSSNLQSDACSAHIDALGPGEAILWCDWKQNLSIPMTHAQTGDQYWATARAEVSCFGAVLFLEQEAERPRKINVLLLSDIIEHTALAASQQLSILAKELRDVSSITCWFDAGPHFRTYSLLAWFQEELVRGKSLKLSVNWFVEKQGKGLVDSLFSMCNAWLQRALKHPSCNITTVKETVSTLKSQAAIDQKNDPGGPRYVVREWVSKQKPTREWVGTADASFQVTKTYSVRAESFGGTSQYVRWHNCYFSHSAARQPTVFSIEANQVAIKNREWRRGFFATPRWKRDVPERGTGNAILERHRVLETHWPENEDSFTSFEKRIARYQKNLQRARQRKHRQRQVVQEKRLSAAGESSSSDSSSDSNSS